MDLGLHHKSALITGASRGLGLAIAQALAAEGCRLAIAARGMEQAIERAPPTAVFTWMESSTVFMSWQEKVRSLIPPLLISLAVLT